MVDFVGELLSFDGHLLQGAQVPELVVAVDGGLDVFEFVFGFDSVLDFPVDVFFVLLEALLEKRVFFLGSFEFDFEQVEGLIELIFAKLKFMNAHHFALIIFRQLSQRMLKIIFLLNDPPELLIESLHFLILPINSFLNHMLLFLNGPELGSDVELF